jgi:homoaconitate hydratase
LAQVGGETFPFEMSLFEERLLAGGGIMPLFKKYGSQVCRVILRRMPPMYAVA